jgi:fatty-acyl-CoA synthase
MNNPVLATANDQILAHIRASAARLDPRTPWLTLLDAEGAASILTPQDILSGANAWAGALSQKGLGPGDRVLVCLHHGADLYLSFLGAMLLGCVPSYAAASSPKQPIAATAQALKQLIHNTAPRALIHSGEIEIEASPNLTLILPSAVSRDSVSTSYWDSLSASALMDDQFLFIQYSSGTTGAKKGVGITSQMLTWQLEQYASSIQASSSDKIVSWLPLYHDMGLITGFFLPIVNGIRLIAMSPFDWVKDPRLLLRAIDQHKATLCWLPNFAYEFLAKYAAGRGQYDLSSMRLFVNCSEPVMEESHKKFLDQFSASGVTESALGTCYAMAETTFAITSSIPGRPARRIRSYAVSTTDAESTAVDHQLERLSVPASCWRECLSKSPTLTGWKLRRARSAGFACAHLRCFEVTCKARPSMKVVFSMVGMPRATSDLSMVMICS